MLVYVVRDGQLFRTHWPHEIKQSMTLEIVHSPKIGICGKDKDEVVMRARRKAKKTHEWLQAYADRYQRLANIAKAKLDKMEAMDTPSDAPVVSVGYEDEWNICTWK